MYKRLKYKYKQYLYESEYKHIDVELFYLFMVKKNINNSYTKEYISRNWLYIQPGYSCLKKDIICSLSNSSNLKDDLFKHEKELLSRLTFFNVLKYSLFRIFKNNRDKT